MCFLLVIYAGDSYVCVSDSYVGDCICILIYGKACVSAESGAEYSGGICCCNACGKGVCVRSAVSLKVCEIHLKSGYGSRSCKLAAIGVISVSIAGNDNLGKVENLVSIGKIRIVALLVDLNGEGAVLSISNGVYGSEVGHSDLGGAYTYNDNSGLGCRNRCGKFRAVINGSLVESVTNVALVISVCILMTGTNVSCKTAIALAVTVSILMRIMGEGSLTLIALFVCISIYVTVAGPGSLTSITDRILICIGMTRAGISRKALVTNIVSVYVTVTGANVFCLAVVTKSVLVRVVMLSANEGSLTFVALCVLILVDVEVAGEGSPALIAGAVTVNVRVTGAGISCAAIVTDAVGVHIKVSCAGGSA